MVEKINVKSHTRKTPSGSTKVEAHTRLVDSEVETAKLKMKEKEALQNADMIAVDELMMYGDNTQQLYNNSFVPIMKNLQKKYDKGQYDKYKATKLWKFHADRIAQAYTKEFDIAGSSSYGTFTPTDRLALAVKYRDEYQESLEVGDWR